MHRETQNLLHGINRDFYRRFSHSFSATRSDPWPGWSRVLEMAFEVWPERAGARSILDVGCGHGRFGRYVAEKCPGLIDYTGVDASLPLLAQGRAALGSANLRKINLLQLDLSEGTGSIPQSDSGYDLIVVFGVLHHIPGFEQRLQLLSALASRLARGGVLAATFWQFADRDRFRRRVIPWTRFNRQAPEPVDLDQLEDGDHLLPWGPLKSGEEQFSERGAQRYCHHACPEEALRLFERLSLTPVGEFLDDGADRALNLYHVGKRPVILPDCRPV